MRENRTYMDKLNQWTEVEDSTETGCMLEQKSFEHKSFSRMKSCGKSQIVCTCRTLDGSSNQDDMMMMHFVYHIFILTFP